MIVKRVDRNTTTTIKFPTFLYIEKSKAANGSRAAAFGQKSIAFPYNVHTAFSLTMLYTLLFTALKRYVLSLHFPLLQTFCFERKNRKINACSCKRQFYCIKVWLEGLQLYGLLKSGKVKGRHKSCASDHLTD